jgi:hypothetical protein
MVAERRWCEIDGCENYVAGRGTKCPAHYAQIERRGYTGPVRDYGLTLEQRYQRAMTLWANAETNDEMRRAWRLVLSVGREFHRAHGTVTGPG